jgi:hypothetical protein
LDGEKIDGKLFLLAATKENHRKLLESSTIRKRKTLSMHQYFRT